MSNKYYGKKFTRKAKRKMNRRNADPINRAIGNLTSDRKISHKELTSSVEELMRLQCYLKDEDMKPLPEDKEGA